MTKTMYFANQSIALAVAMPLALMMSSCGEPPAADTGDEVAVPRTSELKNGKLYDGSSKWRGVVRLDFFVPAIGTWVYCSGQVVSPQTILTAAHCLKGLTDVDPNSNPGAMWVQASRPTSGGWLTVMPLTYTTVKYNPAYDGTATYDVGLVIAPTVQPLQNVAAGDAALLAKSSPNTIMDVIGFGYYDGAGPFDGKGRSGVLAPTYDSVRHVYQFSSTPTDPEICVGDSGGPLKNVLQYGVTSRSNGSRLDGVHCFYSSLWATTRDNLSWLKNNIAGPRSCLETSTLLSCW